MMNDTIPCEVDAQHGPSVEFYEINNDDGLNVCQACYDTLMGWDTEEG